MSNKIDAGIAMDGIRMIGKNQEMVNLDDMSNLAKRLYYAGRFEEAKKLFEKLAELGSEDAIEYLGYISAIRAIETCEKEVLDKALQKALQYTYYNTGYETPHTYYETPRGIEKPYSSGRNKKSR